MPNRRDFFKTSAAAAAASVSASAVQARADVPIHLWEGYDFGPGPDVPDRLNQGPFGLDDGVASWATIGYSSPGEHHVRNYGTGLIGYTWEEGGPARAVRAGRETLEQSVDKLSSLPFVDLLYIRCDWRDVQSSPGRLDLNPVWDLTLQAARQRGLRVCFRVQLSNTVGQPDRLALPDFLRERVPVVKGLNNGRPHYEPKYDHPEFMRAFRELNELLAERFDRDPLVEFMDLMMYGFWGEGHSHDFPNPASPYPVSEAVFSEITRLQLNAWTKVQLAANTQPDSNQAGNRQVVDMVVRDHGWLRSDSVIHDEPIQIERLSNRPPWCAVVMEQGWRRDHDTDKIPVDEAGFNAKEKSMLLALSMGANYWALWTEADNLAKYNEQWPGGITALRKRLGWRVRPGWVWQRERWGRPELILGMVNDGVAGVPGVLRLSVESLDGSLRLSGCLDAGRPYAGDIRQAAFLLPESAWGQKMKLSGELITRGGTVRPVNWSCAQQLLGDGSFPINLKEQGGLRWGEVF
ncbi:MAG: hypothetical protein FVQ81_02975 [Candidatus Glassbacteria bacterium]|nr:hypothetical protein [Candidatus Glassbacteria bacterium]